MITPPILAASVWPGGANVDTADVRSWASWVEGSVFSGQVVTKSTSYTVLDTDRTDVFYCTASLTLGITSAATLGNGFSFGVIAASNAVTVDPAASETVNGSATVTVAAGETWFFYSNGVNWLGYRAAQEGQQYGRNCVLKYTSATVCTLEPKNGNAVQVAGAVVGIPSGGIALSNASIGADALRYVYVYSNAGTPTLEASATVPAVDTTAGNIGVEIKTGDPSRTFVGIVVTNGSGQFENTRASRRVRSAVNDSMSATAVNATASSATSVIPNDNTKPQITEGTEILSVNYTPLRVGNKIRIRVSIPFWTTSASQIVTLAVFDGGADALMVGYGFTEAANRGTPIFLEFEQDVSSVQETTWSVRFGPAAGTLYINSRGDGNNYGGASKAVLTIEEIEGA